MGVCEGTGPLNAAFYATGHGVEPIVRCPRPPTVTLRHIGGGRLVAEGSPYGGKYRWKVLRGGAQLTGDAPTLRRLERLTGEVHVEVLYTLDSGAAASERLRMVPPTVTAQRNGSELRAVGDPAGGTFRWSLVSGDGVLSATDAENVGLEWTTETVAEVRYTVDGVSSLPDRVVAPVPTLELFRGDTLLAEVPFATTDVAATLDSALPPDSQRVEAAERPEGQDAAFAFPAVDAYGANAAADADVDVFRIRLKDLPDDFEEDELELVLKVRDANEEVITGLTGFRYAGLACHRDGKTLRLRRNGRVWESPYLRVATTVDDLSKGDFGIIHSPAPANNLTDARLGKQFGRKLTAAVAFNDGTIDGNWAMGGTPHSRIPVRFTFDSQGVTLAKRRLVYAKLADANAYWAGSGLEFVLLDPDSVATRKEPPPRTMLSLGEYTGCESLADHNFTLTIGISVSQGPDTWEETLECMIPQNTSGADAAGIIRARLLEWRSAHVDELRLDADVYSFASPRLYLSYGGLSLTGDPQDLPLVGTHGPTDITVKKIAGPDDAFFVLGGVSARAGLDEDHTIDAFIPPVDVPFHDANFNPPSATTRHWVRTHGPPGGDHISVVVESMNNQRRMGGHAIPSALCEEGYACLYDADGDTMRSRFVGPLGGDIPSSTAGPVALLNFGRWDEACARLLITISHDSFTAAANDFQHELGHTLSDRNHTVPDPAWFYGDELMHASGPVRAKANRRTRHEILVDTVRLSADTWQAYYETLPSGYGGAMRARIADIAGGWVLG